MKFKVLGHVLFGAMLLSATQAFALIDASLGIGPRRATFTNTGTDTDVKGIDTVLSAHISPIPLPIVNIGFGVAVGSTTWDKEDLAASFGVAGATVTEARGLDVSLEAMVGLSIPFLATPYAKLGYSVLNTQGISAEIPSSAGTQKLVLAEKGKGYTLGLGAKFSILPFISAMAEVSMYKGKLSVDSAKLNGTEVGGSDTDLKSTSFLVGVEVDIGL
jgi:hypothetical protein